jgi:signal transduction histidine kinase
MKSANDGKFKITKINYFNPDQAWARLTIVLGLYLLYVVTFWSILERLGPVGGALVCIPVAVAGWYFGTKAGLIASLVGIGLNTLFFSRLEGGNWVAAFINSWPAMIMVIASGVTAGLFRDSVAERTRIFEDLRSRERYLALINIATKDILNPKKTDARYYYLILHLANLFVADSAHLIRWDASKRQAVLSATTLVLEQPYSEIVLDSSEQKLTESVMETEHTLAINDVPNSNYETSPAVLKQFLPPTQSAILIPLITKEHKLGVVIIIFNKPHHFSHAEIEYADLAGNQIALALWTVEQEIEIQKRLKEANALANIERLLSKTERVGLGTVLQLIVDSARELIPQANYAVLHLLDTEKQILVPRAVSGFRVETTTTKLSMRVGEGIAGRVISLGEVINVGDTRTDPRFLNIPTTVKFLSLVVAPIKSKEQPVGTISIQSSIPNAFSADEDRLLGALGNQAAIAIENADLLETTRQDLKEINALYHVNQGLAISLDPDRLMKDVADLLQQNFGYYHVQIFVVDPESGAFRARQGSGSIGDQLREQGFYLPAGAGIVGHVAETGKPFVTNSVDNIVFFIRSSHLPDTQSELTVPIKVEDAVLGVLDIQHVPPGRLTPRDMQLMTAVGEQLAVALQKAKLYSELQTSLSQEKAMRLQLIQNERLVVVGRLLASISHELNNPIQAIQNALFLIKEEETLSVQGQQDLQIVLSETERMAALIERLRVTYRHTQTEDFKFVQLNNIVEDVYALTATHMRHNEIRFGFLPDPELPLVPAIPDQIRQVVLNLFMNAMEAMQRGGQITVSTQQFADEDKILLSVKDSGTGVSPEILPHIFEPFVTSKETGTGLGLTITYDIVRQHGGDIQVENNPEGGATFNVWLSTGKKG